jgi:hypothetical protein
MKLQKINNKSIQNIYLIFCNFTSYVYNLSTYFNINYMKTKFNPIVTVSKSWAQNIVKIMKWELKSWLSKSELKKILTTWLSMKKNLRTK